MEDSAGTVNEGYQILAQSLSSEQRKALQWVKGGKGIDAHSVEVGAYIVLKECGLVKAVEIDEGQSLILLTQKGRHVAEFL